MRAACVEMQEDKMAISKTSDVAEKAWCEDVAEERMLEPEEGIVTETVAMDSNMPPTSQEVNDAMSKVVAVISTGEGA